MGRLVVIVVLVVLAVWLVRKALRAAATGQEPELRRGDAVHGELVRCAHCGMHLPRVEAREKEGALYCSEEHARLGKG